MVKDVSLELHAVGSGPFGDEFSIVSVKRVIGLYPTSQERSKANLAEFIVV